MTEHTDSARDAARQAWTEHALGVPGVLIERASVDAGFRSYWRVEGSPSRIVMDAPPELEPVANWLRIHDLLQAGGVRVPNVLKEDAAAGFLLLEDLGPHTLLHTLDESNADATFDAAITQLLRLQAIAPPNDLPVYDEAMLTRELRLFDEWFCTRHLGLELDCTDMEQLDSAYRILIDAALAQPQVLVHRDFMPRNLMPASNGPAVLDFQDAVTGPIAYDALSLFKDAFLSWPPQRVDGWLRHYHARASEARLPVPELNQFMRDADFIGVQRHLKVIGIFARLFYRDGKPKYLSDVPRFFLYLDEVLPKYPELISLHTFIETRVKPSIAALEARQRTPPA